MPGITPPPAVPGATPPPLAPGAVLPSRTGDEGRALATEALMLQGSPYRDGGTDPSGFDCSGFVQYVFAKHGVRLPRNVTGQYGAGEDVARTALSAGDLVFFTTTAPGASHVGIVVEEDWFVHAPSARGVVRLDRLSAPYWSQRYVGARRVIGHAPGEKR